MNSGSEERKETLRKVRPLKANPPESLLIGARARQFLSSFVSRASAQVEDVGQLTCALNQMHADL